MLTTDGSLPQQLGVVWSRLLEADSEGPSFISHAACARSVSSSRTSLSCACGALSKAKRMVDVSIALFARFAGNNRIADLISMLA